MMLIPDARRRVTLPANFKAGQPVDIQELEDGTFRLVPMIAIPEHQLWAWRADVAASTATALQEFHEGKGFSLESPDGVAFLKELEK